MFVAICRFGLAARFGAVAALCLAAASGPVPAQRNRTGARAAPHAVTRPLVLWYDRPALAWMTEALPIGNGRLGAMVFGGTADERIQFNENSLWTGTEVNTEDHAKEGAYQSFGDIRIRLPGQTSRTRYRRSLDISRAIAGVEYTANGITYRREYLASHPDEVIAVRLEADSPGGYTGEIELSGAHGDHVSSADGRLSFSGQLDNGERYEAALLVLNDGGSLHSSGAKIAFDGCDALTLYLAAGTDYAPDYRRLWRGTDPHGRIEGQLRAVARRPFTSIAAAHERDFRALFDRVSLDLGASPVDRAALPTDQRLAENAKSGGDPELEALYFQFGRYLLISSSRPGTLPANLQGLWNESNNPPWNCDYHSNINFQMNYWAAEVTNLSECHLAMLDMIRSAIEPWRRQTEAAPEFRLASGLPVRGWAIRTESNIWGGTTWNWNK
ncbi:MAG TPA: glycoside hydrolase family 95 protein, partial [Chthonomonadaceae bacterium]|nr:glycoside hydrolase family 95 protein [Chthonomonadaceae bacterium]